MNYLIAFMDSPDWTDFTAAMQEFINSMFTPLLSIAIALSALWGIYLGIKWWRSAGDEGKRKEAKNAVISFMIGIVVIFVVAVGVPLAVAALIEWQRNNSTTIGMITYFLM